MLLRVTQSASHSESEAYNLFGHNEIEGKDTVIVSKFDGGGELEDHKTAIDGLIQTIFGGLRHEE